jgi:hypothetical protein
MRNFGGHLMPLVRFSWSPILVDLRREVCPSARWQKQGRHWAMSETEAQAFIRAAQARLDFQRSHAQIVWMVLSGWSGSCAVRLARYPQRGEQRRVFSWRLTGSRQKRRLRHVDRQTVAVFASVETRKTALIVMPIKFSPLDRHAIGIEDSRDRAARD